MITFWKKSGSLVQEQRLKAQWKQTQMQPNGQPNGQPYRQRTYLQRLYSKSSPTILSVTSATRPTVFQACETYMTSYFQRRYRALVQESLILAERANQLKKRIDAYQSKQAPRSNG